MNGAPWTILAAIVVGSFAGALLRQTTHALLVAGASWPVVPFGVSVAGGLALGFLTGWINNSSIVSLAWRAPATAATVAALGTFAAAAVVGMARAGNGLTERLMFAAASHIATVILSASIGLALARWSVGR